MELRCSRRRALQLLGASGLLTATAGCSSPGSLEEYSLVAGELDVSSFAALRRSRYLWEDPTDIRATTRVDFTDDTKSQYVSDLFETGNVTVQQWPLVWRSRWGTDTVPRPTFLQRDGTFYQVTITDEQYLERNRWHFAVEQVEEEPPEDAVVKESPIDGLAQDKRVIEAALSAVYAGADDFLGEPEFDELQAIQFHQGLDAEASELIPDPPFEYIKHQHSEEYYRPVTEQRVVSVPEWTYTITEVATSREELVAHARDEIVTHDLSSGLSSAARGVVDDAVSNEDPPRYGESAPPSDALMEVLTRLDIAADLQPIEAYSDRVDFKAVVATYDDSTYSFGLIVTP